MDKFTTISDYKRNEIKIKGSKFIATVTNAETKEMAMEFTGNIRSEFYDATHNCFAYITGWERNEFRASDDGEPSGSAGQPILSAIQKFGYTDIAVVVTRYFGGTKLGVGGLIRAYSEAAEQAIALCKKQIVHRTQNVEVSCSYEEISAMKRLINEYAVDFSEDYTDVVKYNIAIHISKIDEFEKNIVNSTLGKANIKVNNNINLLKL